ncbi:MAG: T9SS type A sorting domain-containing protein [Rhodothermales bacterium]
MKYVLTVLAFSLWVAPLVLAQGTINPTWEIVRTSTVNNGSAEAWGIDVKADGTIYWATNQTRPFRFLDVMFYKLDADGNEIWSAPTIYSDLFAEQIYKVTLAEPVVYLGGRTCTNANPFDLQCDMLILAVDAESGDTLWSTLWGQGIGYEEADGLVVEPDGIYITGWTDSGATNLDVALLKLDLQGELLWSNPWGTDLTEHQDGHSVVDSSFIYIAGVYRGGLNLFFFAQGFDGEALVAKFSKADGSYVDHISFGVDDPWVDLENALGMASDGEFLYVVGITTVAEGNNDIFLHKYDKALNRIWATTWSTEATESARAIALGDDGTIYVGGNTDGAGEGGLDVALLAFTNDGDFINAQTWGGTDGDHALDILVRDGFIYLTGKFNCIEISPLNEVCDAYLLKVDPATVVSTEAETPIPAPVSVQQNYPNPFSSATTFTFSLPRPGYATLKIYNLLGQEVATAVAEDLPAGMHSRVWEAQGIPNGVYFYRFTAGASTITKKMLLVR